MASFNECEDVEAQMPFYLSITCLVVKMVLTVLIFGPETMKPDSSTDLFSRMKAKGKNGFKWSCLFLAIYTLISDVRRVLALTQMKSPVSGYFCAATIWTGSSNAATGFAMVGLNNMFTFAQGFNDAHNKSLEEMQMIRTDIDRLIREQKGIATVALLNLTGYLYFLPIWLGCAPLLLLGVLLFFWIFVPALVLGFVFGELFHEIVMRVKARTARSQTAPDDSEEAAPCCLVPELDTDTESEDDGHRSQSLVAEPVLPFDPVETPEAARRVYEKLGDYSATPDEHVMKIYRRDLETFQVLGTRADAVEDFARWPFWSITICVWAPLLVGRFVTAMIWESQGFWEAYWDSAVVKTFGERHWWLYRDYLIKTCNSATWGGCQSVYLGLLNRIWP